MMRSFWLGSISAKRSVAATRANSASLVSFASSSPVRMLRCAQADGLGQVRGDVAVVAGDDLDPMPRCRERLQRLRHAGLGRVEEKQEAGEGEVRLVLARVGFPVCGTRRTATPSTRNPSMLQPRTRSSMAFARCLRRVVVSRSGQGREVQASTIFCTAPLQIRRSSSSPAGLTTTDSRLRTKS